MSLPDLISGECDLSWCLLVLAQFSSVPGPKPSSLGHTVFPLYPVTFGLSCSLANHCFPRDTRHRSLFCALLSYLWSVACVMPKFLYSCGMKSRPVSELSAENGTG